MAVSPSLAVAAAAGVVSHLAYFNRGEHHMWGVTYINLFLLSFIGITAALVNGNGYSIGHASGIAGRLLGSWLVGVYTRLLVYRVFFNKLNRFPGPWAARLSHFYMVFNLTKSDGYYKFQQLHKKYGDYVRIGATDLSIADADAVEIAMGNGSKISKADWYDGDAPLTSMHTSRDKALHDKRRRLWSPAFSEKALREYEPKIDALNDKLIQRISEFKGGAVNVTKWFNLYSFDVMGRLAFGKDYEMLDSGEKHHALELLSEGMQPLAYRLPIWFFRILVQIPGAGAGFQKFVKFCVDELEWRCKNAAQSEKEGGSDIMSWILKAYKDIKQPYKDTLLQADSRLLIVAGSDTTAAAFTYLFYYLAQAPNKVKALREELDTLTRGDWTDKDVRSAPYLNACINEALRLHPPVPSGVARRTPPEGMQVGKNFVPGNTTFWIPLYVLARDERYYVNANSFEPERWTDKPEMIKHADAYAPFTIGPFGCIGKNLALMELRTLTTRLIQKFDVKLAPGEDGKKLLHGTLDHFTVNLGDLNLVFNERK